MRGAADHIEWATVLGENMISMASNWPTLFWRKLPNTSAGSSVILSNTLSMDLSGPRVMYIRCSRMGPMFQLRDAAYTIGMGQIFMQYVLHTVCKWPMYLLRKLPNSSDGLFVLLLNVLSMYLNGPSISHERCC
jgi:hypothetical protein